MKHCSLGPLLFLLLLTQITQSQDFLSLSKKELLNKIKGGWAGQTIGVTFGAPVEFRFQGTMMNDYQTLAWNDSIMKKTMIESPGVYDDLYLDISFVEVFDKFGLDASAMNHANAIAHADYMLWHANQTARTNILNGLKPPESGFWINNPHADCIDFQIEADFAGLMSPMMPNTASSICDKIGHIMNYGDGWYGGVFVSNMYALAFKSNDIRFIVAEALKAIPENTKYHACISDVIKWHKQYPDNWKSTWFEIQNKWTDDTGCPGGVFSPFNIDATVNSAYVVLGLLYGNGDFSKTLNITTRCGQDADCNPSTAAGILGVMMGYDKIPAQWKMGLDKIEDIDFKYTSTSLNKVYKLSYSQALENIVLHGGKIIGDDISIKTEPVKTVKWEQSFIGMTPVDRKYVWIDLKDEYEFNFSGNGFVINGEYKPKSGSSFDADKSKVGLIDLYIDGVKKETLKLPMNFTIRQQEIAWNYQLEDTAHKIKLKLINPNPEAICMVTDLIIYSPGKTPAKVE